MSDRQGYKVARKFSLDNANLQINESFRESQRDYIKQFVKTIIDSEDFTEFSKYSKGLVIEYFQAFLSRLVSQIWASFATPDVTPEKFFKNTAPALSRQLNKAKQSLLAKDCLSDSMNDTQVTLVLESFFKEYDDRSEYKKAQDEYVDIKQDFRDIEELVHGLQNSGYELIKNSEYLLSKYLNYKSQILKNMGYDVVLEYYGIDNFNFLYRDDRLADPKVRADVEHKAMNAALKALMPSFNGDISVFAKIVANIK